MTLERTKRWSLGAAMLAAGLVAGSLLTGGSTPPAVAMAGGPAGDAAPMIVRPSIPEIVKRVSPAVVSIGATKRAYVYDPYYDFFTPFFRRRETRQRIPYMGSGFLIDREGHILTNFHVIQDSEEVFVTFTDGREVPARVIETDRFIDVALLRVDVQPDELPEPLPLGSSQALEIGETAIALGNPFGNLIEDPRPTVTKGVISALHRSFRPDQQTWRVYHDMIQTDAAINPGNSGGPLVDAAGRAVGLNTFILSRDGGSMGLGFAIPIDRIKSFVNEVKTHGRLRNLLLDFGVMTLRTPRIQGVLVSEMRLGGPGEAAGLEVGDVIVAVDGRQVTTREEFILMLASRQVGDTMTLTVWRSGEERKTTYTIEEAVN